MILDLSSLRNAIAQTEDALAYGSSDLARADARLALHLRAAAKAQAIFDAIPGFLTEARFLLARITERQASVR